jgi:hypothetical protein
VQIVHQLFGGNGLSHDNSPFLGVFEAPRYFLDGIPAVQTAASAQSAYSL